MIHVTRLNHTPVILNCDLIEHVETTPDTVISLTTGQKLMGARIGPRKYRTVVRFRRSIILGEGLTVASRQRNPWQRVRRKVSPGQAPGSGQSRGVALAFGGILTGLILDGASSKIFSSSRPR